MHVSRNKIERAIEKRLTEAMSNEKPPIGPELAQYLAEWGQWLGSRDGSCRSSDWHVHFLRWALGGRAGEFKQWAERKGTEQTEGALAAIQKVCEFNWPRNFFTHFFKHSGYARTHEVPFFDTLTAPVKAFRGNS